MNKKLFDAFRTLIYDQSGITMNDKKEALISARISKRMKVLQITEPGEYLDFVLGDNTGTEMVHLLDAMATNVTHFFREPRHFELLRETVMGWHMKGNRRLRIWSAGCSSGEEPYSIAITLLEAMPQTSPDIKILATDISTKILRKSTMGMYDPDKMEQLSPLLKDHYFDKTICDGEQYYTVKRTIRNLIVFRRLNLSEVPYPMKGPMDIIFCRNVMIYFDNEVRKKLLNEFFRLLKPGGLLMVGHAESLTGMISGFKIVEPSVYVKK